MRTTMLTAATALLLAAAVPGHAEVTGTDRDFLTRATQDAMAEVQDAQWANRTNQPPAMKELAQQIIRNHSAVLADLKKIAQAGQLRLPARPTNAQQNARDDLKGKDDKALQHSYLQREIDRHGQSIALFQQESQNGKDPRLSGIAAHYLPILQQERAAAERAQQTLGTS